MTLRVAQLTDIHLTAKTGSELYGVDTAQSLQKIVDVIKRLADKPDVVIATGDLAEDGAEATYIRLRALLETLGIPVYVLLGNHDDISVMRSVLASDGFHCTNTMTMQGWGFVFVNSQLEGYSHGYIGPDELIELEKNINALPDYPILVTLHHTPSKVCPSFGCQLENAKEFTELLNRHSNIKGVIAGHTHNACEIDAGGHTQFTTPSTFAKATHAQAGESVDHDDFWACHSLDGSLQGFRILDLLPDGMINSEVHWLNRENCLSP